MKTVAFIPVRGGSKSIPGKNIKPLAGKPLVYWTAKAASDCEGIDVVYVSTDDERISSVVEALQIPKVQVVGRSGATATDTASTESALLEFATRHHFENVILIQATSPLLSESDLTKGLERFRSTRCDTLLSTVHQKRFIWSQSGDGVVKPLNYNPAHRPRRQDFDGYQVENGAFYIMKREGLLSSGSRLHGSICSYVMDESTFVEIDEPADWLAVERELLKRRAGDSSLRERIKRIKLVLTDVDGVLTDAGMYYSEKGDELKKFNTRDGKGFELLREAGIKTGIITSEDTVIVTRRAEKLKIDYLYQGARNKIPALEDVLEKANVSLDEVAYIGDDLADIAILERVGLSACPNDAVDAVRSIANVCVPVSGGAGAFRSLAELILIGR